MFVSVHVHVYMYVSVSVCVCVCVCRYVQFLHVDVMTKHYGSQIYEPMTLTRQTFLKTKQKKEITFSDKRLSTV